MTYLGVTNIKLSLKLPESERLIFGQWPKLNLKFDVEPEI